LLDATGDLVVVMDSDGQHQPSSVLEALTTLEQGSFDLVIGSRFHAQAQIQGLEWPPRNRLHLGQQAGPGQPARLPPAQRLHEWFFCPAARSLPAPDPGRGCKTASRFSMSCWPTAAASCGSATFPCNSNPGLRQFQAGCGRALGFAVSILHALSLRLLPRRAISFGLVGASGFFVQLLVTRLVMLLG
jgi:dolichol-phosphate mannosyltransferase